MFRSWFLVAAVVLAVGCTSAVEQQERSYQSKRARLALLAGQAEPEVKKAIEAAQAQSEKDHAGLATDPKVREEGLGKLNQQLTASLEEFEKQVEAGSVKVTARRLAALVGTWKGEGVVLAIDRTGHLRYESSQGGASKKLDVPIASIGETSFQAGVFGLNTTFQLDGPPRLVDGAWKLKVDGRELTREEP